MSTRGRAHYDQAPVILSTGLVFGIGVSALLFFGLGLDLLAFPGLGVPCPFHAITGLACPGCGMTRAILLVSQLQWLPALRMNPLVYLLLCIAALSLGKRVTSLAVTSRTSLARRSTRTR